MRNKPIKFETSHCPNSQGGGFFVEVWPHDEHGISIQCSTGGVIYRDPAKLRELAAKINEAAQALEESKRLTFADLKPGEWFRWRPGGAHGRKVDDHEWYSIIDKRNVGAIAASTVVRLVATFTEAPNE